MLLCVCVCVVVESGFLQIADSNQPTPVTEPLGGGDGDGDQPTGGAAAAVCRLARSMVQTSQPLNLHSLHSPGPWEVKELHFARELTSPLYPPRRSFTFLHSRMHPFEIGSNRTRFLHTSPNNSTNRLISIYLFILLLIYSAKGNAHVCRVKWISTHTCQQDQMIISIHRIMWYIYINLWYRLWNGFG